MTSSLSIEHALARIEAAFIRLGLPVRDLLRPGVSRGTVEKEFRPFGITPSDELARLWNWHDGTDVVGRVLDETHFFPGFYLVSHADSIEHHRRFRTDHRWDPSWVPIFANGGGDFYVVSLTASRQPTSEVVGFILGEETHPVEFLSLTVMLEVIAECYEDGAYFLSDDGYLESNDDVEIAIASRLNPGVERWAS